MAHSLSPSTIERVKYKLGEGITGGVIQTGKAVAIPKISEEPLFLDRTASRKIRKGFKELSFICVPIKKGNQVIGALSVDRTYEKGYSLKDGQKLLSVVATMIAQHVINLEIIRREKEQLRGREQTAARGTGKQIPHHQYHRQQQQNAGSLPDDLPGCAKATRRFWCGAKAAPARSW